MNNNLIELDDSRLKDLLAIVARGYEDKHNYIAQFNVIDELHADENAHTRILVSLLKVDFIRKSFLRMIRSELSTDKQNKPNEVLSDVAIENTTAEEVKMFSQYVDAQIVHQNSNGFEAESLAVIIENKVKGAVDQPNQIERYIDTIRNTYQISPNRIIVVYLTLDGQKDVSKGSLSDEYKNKIFKYLPLSYAKNIIPWLKKGLVFSLDQVLNQHYLSSGITQYVHHLNGLLGNRQDDKESFINKLATQVGTSLNGTNPYMALARINFEIGLFVSSDMTKIINNTFTKSIIRQWLRRKFYWHFNKVVSDDDNGTYIELDNYALAMYDAYEGQPGDLLYVDFFFENGDANKYKANLEDFTSKLCEVKTKVIYWDGLTYNGQSFIRIFISSKNHLDILFSKLPSNLPQNDDDDSKNSDLNCTDEINSEKLERLIKLRDILTHHIKGLDERRMADYSDSQRSTHYAYKNHWAWQRAPWNVYGEAAIQVFPRNSGDEVELIKYIKNLQLNHGKVFPVLMVGWRNRIVIEFPLKDLNYENNLLRFLGEWKLNGIQVLEGISPIGGESNASV